VRGGGGGGGGEMGSGAIAPHSITLPGLGYESREGGCVPLRGAEMLGRASNYVCTVQYVHYRCARVKIVYSLKGQYFEMIFLIQSYLG
jgi:hypothetical protein